ncbi:MAG: polyphosphate kinase 2 [Alsobacter sp.]
MSSDVEKSGKGRDAAELVDHRESFRSAARALVKVQHRVIKKDLKVLIILEGRDAAGKDGAIKRVTKHMSPRDTHVVALGRPNERDNRAWYFERWIAWLPVAGEITFFNRSWYNRAGVERVMGFCSRQEAETFLTTVPIFENLLSHCGFLIFKYYLDVSRREQKRRLRDRREDPLKRWKRSPVDDRAIELWDDYSEARNEMLLRTSSDHAPWTVLRADDKDACRLALMHDIIRRLDPERGEEFRPDEEVIRRFSADLLDDGFLAP